MVLVIAAFDDSKSKDIQAYLVKKGYKFTKEDNNTFNLDINDRRIADKLLPDLKYSGYILFRYIE